tara:strand:+ start:189 stop:350 length:162 start_codon:yes stop_codon:yes gene_type:complete
VLDREKYQVAKGTIEAISNNAITKYVAVDDDSISVDLITLKFGSTTGLSIADG